MTVSQVAKVQLVGLASAIPDMRLTVADDAKVFGLESAQKVSSSIGVSSEQVVSGKTCTSDLCYAAAQQLLDDLQWPRDSVDLVIFVSQTPDYLLPATSCSLHGRLGLAKHCAAFDINLGCSGYIYGLWIAAQIVSSGGAKRALLLAGDTISRIVSPQDRSTAPLFGDAGTATALEFDAKASEMVYILGTDGSGQQHLIVPAGGFRNPHTTQTSERTERENGNIRSDEDLFMDGAEVFTFTLREVPSLIASIMTEAKLSIEDVDAFVFHQANTYMLNHLAKRMRLPRDKFVLAMEDFGNTSSASIPLAMTHALGHRLQNQHSQLILAGFGVGLSWGSVSLTCGPMVMSEIVRVSGDETDD